jgi:hypothetical protein
LHGRASACTHAGTPATYHHVPTLFLCQSRPRHPGEKPETDVGAGGKPSQTETNPTPKYRRPHPRPRTADRPHPDGTRASGAAAAAACAQHRLDLRFGPRPVSPFSSRPDLAGCAVGEGMQILLPRWTLAGKHELNFRRSGCRPAERRDTHARDVQVRLMMSGGSRMDGCTRAPRALVVFACVTHSLSSFSLRINISLLFFCDERRIILYDSWVHQHITSTLDYKIVLTL